MKGVRAKVYLGRQEAGVTVWLVSWSLSSAQDALNVK